MSLLLTRFCAYFTLIAYLVVGSVAVRFCLPESVTFTFNTTYLNLVSDAPVKAEAVSILEEPIVAFDEIKIPVEVIAAKAKAVVKIDKVVTEIKPAEMIIIKSSSIELPFQETIKLSKIIINKDLQTELVALYKDLEVVDEVKTKLAANENAEPEFFDYPVEASEENPTKENNTPAPTVVETAPETVVTEEVVNVFENSEPSKVADTSNTQAVVEDQASEKEPEFFDYPTAVTTQAAEVAKSIPVAEAVKAAAPIATTTTTNVLAFDYSKANKALDNQTIPTVSHVNTQKPSSVRVPDQHETADLNKASLPINLPTETITKSEVIAPTGYRANLSVLALGSNLKKIESLQGFEVRFQDDLSEMIEDYGSGEVNVEANLSQPKMTRTITILKKGYTPTSSEIILEEGNGSVSVPMIEDEIFHDLQGSYERKGPVGAVLIELDDETELAKLDVPFGDVVKLDGDFKRTKTDDFRYQLFIGVQAGNTMVSYLRRNGEITYKILHVHENELVYDANFYETVSNDRVHLFEEDLLAKESSPLIISSEDVKVFAGKGKSQKINNHTYEMNFEATHLGGRRYIELNHQSEPVFVGIRDNNKVTVPSENFMRFMLSNLEGSKLANRCMIQINLAKTAERYDVAAESVASSLSTYTQVLDSDGKFYDSMSEKTQKIVVVGESDGTAHISPEAKINIKIQYTDGTVQFLNSYCSPNTYLVEQL